MDSGRKLASPARSAAIAILILILGMACRPLGAAEESVDSPPAHDLPALIEGTGRLPGVDLAEGISQITGTAVSPLLGVSAIGTWTYFSTAAEHRDQLPWYCQPLAWGIGFSVLALCFAKDSLGIALPPLVKKPLDFLELFENKASAAIASTAFVPLIAAQMSQRVAASRAAATETASFMSGEGTLLASAPMPTLSALPLLETWLLVPLAIFGFLVVWLLGHAINVLMLLSPFGIVDAFLKFIRLLAIAVIVTITAIFPTLGVILCLALIVIAALLAPAAFRLAAFGSLMGGDYLVSLVRRKKKCGETVRGFLARKTEHRLKARSFGKLECDHEGQLSFVSRWLFIGPRRRVVLSEESGSASLNRGLLFPSLAILEHESQDDAAPPAIENGSTSFTFCLATGTASTMWEKNFTLLK